MPHNKKNRTRFIPYFNITGAVPGTLHNVLLNVGAVVFDHVWDQLSEDGKTIIISRLTANARVISGWLLDT